MDETSLSKLLSLILRHKPGRFGLTLDEAGWIAIAALLPALAQHHGPVSRAQIEHIVRTSDKQRFSISDDGERIRAVQGHSRSVELGLTPQLPPPVLFHGTVARYLSDIRRLGLQHGRRQYVHLSADVETARAVGRRRGKPIVLQIDAGSMARDNQVFFLSNNGVWLCKVVPVAYIVFPSLASYDEL